MAKIMIMPSSKEMIEKAQLNVDAYLLGIKGFSVNCPAYFEIEEADQIVNELQKQGKEIFISLNKNMFSSDLKPLETLLEHLETLNLTGICYYDISIPSIVKRRGFKTPLVWSQEHFTTNYLTMNYWYESGVSYTLLSSEITLEEVEEMKNKTNMKLISLVFGYIPMFYSKRPLVTNYKKHFNLKDDGNLYYMEKGGKKYPLLENGTSFEGYHGDILNAYDEAFKMPVDYLLLNSFMIEEETFLKVVDCYKNQNEEALAALVEKNDGFFSQKTVYRVKDL